MINIVCASTTPRKRFMNITIMIDQKEDHQHKKCISNPKRGIFKNHNLQWPLQSPLEKERKMLEFFFINKTKGSKRIGIKYNKVCTHKLLTTPCVFSRLWNIQTPITIDFITLFFKKSWSHTREWMFYPWSICSFFQFILMMG
jgi:hypothetical protein